MENKVNENIFSYYSIGDIIRRYRNITKLTQNELCYDLNNYLKEIGFDKFTVSQTSMAKYEAGNAVPDNNVVRYLNDRILKTGIDVKAKVLYIVEKVKSITDVPIDDIEQLLRVKNKQQIIDFIQRHIAQPDSRLDMNVKNDTFRLIVEELFDFPEEVHMDLNHDIGSSPISHSLNATALLLLYLTYQYISIQFDNNYLYSSIRDFGAEKKIKIPARSRVSKMDMVNLLEHFVYRKSWISFLVNSFLVKSFKLATLKVFFNLLAKEGIMFHKNDPDEKKAAVMSKIADSVRIIGYFGYLVESPERYDRIKPFVWEYSKVDSIDIYVKNIKLAVNDPLILIGYLFKLYPYKSLINTVDELNQQLQSLLEQKGSIAEFINKEAFQLRAKSIFENRKLKEVDKKLALFHLMETLHAVNDWRV